MHVFIDTNVFISFYDLSKSDVEELQKLVTLADQKRFTLVTSTHLRDEISRQREPTLFSMLAELRNFRFAPSIPAFARSYGLTANLIGALKTADGIHTELLNTLAADIAAKELAADKLIDALFLSVTPLEISDDLYAAAARRKSLGNPPGNNSTIGDELHWEVLVEHVPFGEKLVIVSADKDYQSKLSAGQLHPMLVAEWRRVKGDGSVELHTTLAEFLRRYFPQIKVDRDVDRFLLIHQLGRSDSKSTTEDLVSILWKEGPFSVEQVEQLIEICHNNLAVRNSLVEPEVFAFFSRLHREHEMVLSNRHDRWMSFMLDEARDSNTDLFEIW